MVNVTLSAATKQRLFDLMAENDCSLSELMERFAEADKQRKEPQTVNASVMGLLGGTGGEGYLD